MIEAYITNLGKYNEGELYGEYLKLPAEKADVQALLARIGVDGYLYQETFITDYETQIDGLYNLLGEYESVNELNYLAALLESMEDYELEKYEAALEYGEYTSSVKDLINLAQNLGSYEYYPNIRNEEDLGYYLIKEYGCEEIPERLEHYFDYAEYGRDYCISESGVFTKNGGYVENNHGSFKEYYDGRRVPDEHRIFAYPDPPEKMPIAKQLEMYAKMIAAPAAEKLVTAREERG